MSKYCQYKIGFPYGSKKRTRKSGVTLYPCTSSGFKSVSYKNEIVSIPDRARGVSILDGIPFGTTGVLFESNEKGLSVVKEGKVKGQGRSMELSLVLSTFSRYKKNSFDRLIMFSAALDCPEDSNSYIEKFKNSKIKSPYPDKCPIDERMNSLINKYEVCKLMKAEMIAFHTNDANLLTSKLGIKSYSLKEFFCNNLDFKVVPCVVALSTTDFNDLLKYLNISLKPVSLSKIFSRFLFIASCIVLFWFFVFFPNKNLRFYSAYNLNSGIYVSEHADKDLVMKLKNPFTRQKIPRHVDSDASKKDRLIALAYDRSNYKEPIIFPKKSLKEYQRFYNYTDEFEPLLRSLIIYNLQNQNYKKSFILLDKLADLGDKNAINTLGVMYIKGIGTNVDFEKGAFLIKKAAKAEDLLAKRNVVLLGFPDSEPIHSKYKDLELEPTSYMEGGHPAFHMEDLLKKYKDKYYFICFPRIHKNDKDLTSFLIPIHWLNVISNQNKKLSLKRDVKKGYNALFEAIEKGKISAMRTLSLVYLKEKNFKHCFFYLDKLMKKNDPFSFYIKAYCFYKGLGIKKDEKKCFELMKKSSAYGYKKASTMISSKKVILVYDIDKWGIKYTPQCVAKIDE